MEETQIVSAPGRKGGGAWWVVILLIIIGVGAWWWIKGNPLSSVGGSTDTYQAVFLDNNQVYFGKLTNQNQQYAKLTEIFYLQVSQPLQPSEPSNNVNLVKLGGELHGPADIMMINRDHILFIEDLIADSQVVKAIATYKASLVKK